MGSEEFVIALLGIVAGTVTVSVIFGGIFSVIKTAINQKKTTSEVDPQFFRALTQFKKNTEYRLSNLESIATDTDEIETSSNRRRLRNG